MSTLDSLKISLGQAALVSSLPKRPISDELYLTGLELLMQGSEWDTYVKFIIPQLNNRFASILDTKPRLSVLEIGPGPKTVLSNLNRHLRDKIVRYTAFEPNRLSVRSLKESLASNQELKSPFPSLELPPEIHATPFILDSDFGPSTGAHTPNEKHKFDIILFCHSLYGMNPKTKFIENALRMLVESPKSGQVIVFHRAGNLHIDGLPSHSTAIYPTGTASVKDHADILDIFASFIAGFKIQDDTVGQTVKSEWRKVCRALGRKDPLSNSLSFHCPAIMITFTKNSLHLPELLSTIPPSSRKVKNREACYHESASVLKPTKIRHVQDCVKWAQKNTAALTIIGGGHSGHCLWPNVVAIDMSAFDQIHIVSPDKRESLCEVSPLVVAEAGCVAGEIVSKALQIGRTVPMGARPSVGAGLWLQGGIGHLTRLYGLTCDAIVGVVMVSINSGQILSIGEVPKEHRPVDAICPSNERDLLWAVKGAGTNFGIVISMTFKTFPAPDHVIRDWIFTLGDQREFKLKFDKYLDHVKEQPSTTSTDAYLYTESGQLHLGVSMFERHMTEPGFERPATFFSADGPLGPENECKTVNSVEVFETEMYVSKMHGGHGGGKTSSFKRCVFLKSIEYALIEAFLEIMETRPSPFCYLHILHGGGAAQDIAANATAFGCRDWKFACVVTGIWPREKDQSQLAYEVVRWVYKAVQDILPLSCGVYSADLGPDPRDQVLADRAFGPNRTRLAHLKRELDPCNILRYACPLRKPPVGPKLVIMVTGESCAGKDYCADIWASQLVSTKHGDFVARKVSISDSTKREYAVASGADFHRLLWDRPYKERHRAALTLFFEIQKQRRPELPEQHFLEEISKANDVDVLLITGMRDDAPVSNLSHLVTGSRLIEVRVITSRQTLRNRFYYRQSNCRDDEEPVFEKESQATRKGFEYCPTLTFANNATGSDQVEKFAEDNLLPLLNGDLERLARMVRRVTDFPCSGIDFRHVLNISQIPSGLSLCISLMKANFTGDWSQIRFIASCEVGGFVFASPLSMDVNIPLALIRDAGKLPPPMVSVPKPCSHISAPKSNRKEQRCIGIDPSLFSADTSVLLVDDVLASGKTLCSVLQLLEKTSLSIKNVSIMVVAELPMHRGRNFLRQNGYGFVQVQSLLVFDGT